MISTGSDVLDICAVVLGLCGVLGGVTYLSNRHSSKRKQKAKRSAALPWDDDKPGGRGNR